MNVTAGTRETMIPDIQGSILATLDSGSGVLTKTGYRPYGESASTTGTFQYTGLRIDPETNGLYYARTRMYSPTLGRFLQVDPIGYAGGVNLYAYVQNDPLNLTDPNGQDPQDTRSPDQTLQFYVAVHPAAFSGDPFFHGAIWIVNSNTYSGGITTLGGQPAPALTSTGLALVGNSNFLGDLNINNNSQLLPIQVPSGQSPSQFATNLTAAAASYGNNQPYSLFPGITPQTAYNSNSFVSGVIQAAGGNAPGTGPFSTPGYGIPLPLAPSNSGQGSSLTSSPPGK